MKAKRLFGYLFGSLICVLACLPVRAADPAKLVPQDAAIYVEVSNASQIVDRLLAPDIVGLLDSIPQFRQFTQSDQFAQLRAVVSYIETKLGTNWRKAIGDLTGGGAVFAVRPGQPDYVLFVVRAKDADLLRRTNDLLIELAEQDALDKGRESPVKKKEYKGVMAWSVGKDEYHALIGDTIVLSNKSEGLKAALEMNAGEGPASVANDELWRRARDRAPADRVAWAFVRMDVLRQAGIAKEFYQEKAPNPALPIFFGGLGHVASRAPYLAASLVLNDERLALRVEMPRDGELWPEQFRGFYGATPGAEAAAPLRPARTIASLSFYRDFKAMWDARERLVAAEALPGFTELEANVGPVLFGGREFSNEVLGEFGPHFRLVAAAQDFSRSKQVPDIKLPAFALVAELKHPQEFGQELIIAFHSVLGLANVGLGQQSQPRFMLLNETYKGFDIQGARFFERAAAKSDAGVHLRQNFSPACTIAGRYFVLGSTVEIVKDVIDALGDVNAPPKTTEHNIVFEIDTSAAIGVLKQNREALVSQNMVSGGNTREQAEQEIDTLLRVLGLFGDARATWTADAASMRVDVAIKFATTAEGGARRAEGKK
jgi:hypothetical protein